MTALPHLRWNLANAYGYRARWIAARGMDPASHFGLGSETHAKAVASNPDNPTAPMMMGGCRLRDKARWRLERGPDPMGTLQEAIRRFDESIHEPALPAFYLKNRAEACALLGEVAQAKGQPCDDWHRRAPRDASLAIDQVIRPDLRRQLAPLRPRQRRGCRTSRWRRGLWVSRAGFAGRPGPEYSVP